MYMYSSKLEFLRPDSGLHHSSSTGLKLSMVKRDMQSV